MISELKGRASLVAHIVRKLPAMQKTQVWSLSRENPLEKGMAPCSSILVWRIPWTEEPGRLQSMGSLRAGHDFTFTFHFHALEKEMATHSSILAWKSQSIGWQRVRHN